MKTFRIDSITTLMLLASLTCGAAAYAQQQSAPAAEAPNTIKVETRIVLVDTVVTDKKGNYIRDLGATDFKVWEDGKEQSVTSFSREDDNADPSKAQRHYLVLLFDNSTVEFGDQAKARAAAAKFIDSNVSPNRLIAVAEFGGMLRISQNFTADGDRLKKVVAGVKFSSVSPNAPTPDLASTANLPPQPQAIGLPGMGDMESDFGARSVFMALRNLAKGLSGIPGRKSVVFLTAGFSLNMELQSELTAVIDACNKANVAIYPVDVRGLVATVPTTIGASHPQRMHPHSTLRNAALTSTNHPLLWNVSFVPDPQKPGGGGGAPGGGGGGGHGGGGPGGGGGTGGGGHGGGGTGGSGGTGGGHGGTGGTGGGHGNGGGGTGFANTYIPPTQPRQILPQLPDNVTDNQQFLYQLANGTGGFVILNTNDLVGGMERIAKDQSEYYLLGYKPPDTPDGSCHTLKVKVNRGGTNVRSRSGYCKVRPADLLAGTTTEKELEKRSVGELQGNVTASMRAPYFYSAPDVARVHLVLDIPSNSLQFDKVKGKQHAEVNVLGIATKPDGTVAARFSDTANLDFEGKKEVEEFQKAPFHYENQFEIAPGTYNLRVVFSSGNKTFGKIENPLEVTKYDGKEIAESSVALSNSIARVSDMQEALDSQLVEDRKPLISRGFQIMPSATNHFKKTDNGVVYVEVYDPLLAGDKPPQIALEFRIVDKKSGQQKLDVGVTDTKELIKPGNPLVPVALRLPLDTLPPGSYRVDLRAGDTLNHTTDFRSAEFEVE